MHEHGAVERARNDGLFVAAKVVAKLGGIAVLVEDGNSFFVADARERRLDAFELLRIAFEGFELAWFVLQDALHDGADEAFANSHGFIQFHVGSLWFEHPEFSQVASGLRFFRAERGAKGIDLAQRHG